MARGEEVLPRVRHEVEVEVGEILELGTASCLTCRSIIKSSTSFNDNPRRLSLGNKKVA